MSNQPNETSMVLTPRQEYLQRVRDEMAPGEKPAAIVPHTFAELVTMCQALATAELVPKALRGKATDMALVIMTGAEVGLPPMASLRLYTTWDGVPRLMAEGIRAIMLQSPVVEYFEVSTCSDTEATWIGKRRGRPEKTATWTIARAKQAELLGRDNWKKYPQDMLNARASMQLARMIAPDVVAGMVALEEAKDGDFIDAQAVETKPVFVAPPPPQGPPPGVPVTGAVVFDQKPDGKLEPRMVTVTDTGTKPTEPRRGPGRPPKAQPSQTPGTDPFRAAREAVDARTEERKIAEGVRGGPTAPADEAPNGPAADPTSSGGSPSSSTTETATSAPSETRSTASTESADDFGGSEDPPDSGTDNFSTDNKDPGLQLIEDLKVFLAKCKSQTEMQNGRPPFAERSTALYRAGDKRCKAYDAQGPAGELTAMMGKLWAERKAQLPV